MQDLYEDGDRSGVRQRTICVFVCAMELNRVGIIESKCTVVSINCSENTEHGTSDYRTASYRTRAHMLTFLRQLHSARLPPAARSARRSPPKSPEFDMSEES
jgi:hypothetical protein